MKGKLLLLATLLTMVGAATAQNSVTVDDFTLPQNGGGITVQINLDQSNFYNSYGFEVVTPSGFSYPVDNEDLVPCKLSGHTGNLAAHFNDGDRVLTVGFMQSSGIQNQTISLWIPLEATAEEVESTHDFTIKKISFNTTSFTKVTLDDVVTFTVTIGEPADTRTVLDENSTIAPEAAEGVDVRVKRTIKANEWSTICLPFAMTEAQVEAAFGTDVLLADFTGVETTEEEGDVIGISLKFIEATSIEANHPYLIKVSEAVSEFTVDGVDIDPEDEPSLDMDEYRTGSGTKKDPYVYHYNSFVGTYVANTEVPNLCLFLSGDKFWYSTGATKMKAFRGYFDFYDVLTDVEDNYAGAKVRMDLDEGATAISVVDAGEVPGDGVYTLQGVLLGETDVENLPNGIYVVKGKKVIKK